MTTSILLRLLVHNGKWGKGFKNYLFVRYSERSNHWFDLDIYWLEENFITIKLQFYKWFS